MLIRFPMLLAGFLTIAALLSMQTAAAGFRAFKNMEFPIVLEGSPTPAGTLFAGEIGKSMGKRLFFKVALAPELKVSKIRLEILNRTNALEVLRAMPRLFELPSSDSTLLIQNLEIVLAGEKTPLFTAREARWKNASERFELTDLQIPGEEAPLSAAVLHLSGDHAGRVTWPRNDQTLSIIILKPSPTQ